MTQECPIKYCATVTRVSFTVVPEQCPANVSHTSVLHECNPRVSVQHLYSNYIILHSDLPFLAVFFHVAYLSDCLASCVCTLHHLQPRQDLQDGSDLAASATRD